MIDNIINQIRESVNEFQHDIECTTDKEWLREICKAQNRYLLEIASDLEKSLVSIYKN